MKKKVSHIWYYYKWYILAAVLVVWVAADFVWDMKSTHPPDTVVSIVTVSPVSEETREKLGGFFEACWGDRNGDGQVMVEVNVYAYDGRDYTGTDPDAYSAAAIHLASEVRSGTTDLFLSDAAELMAEAEKVTQWGLWEDFPSLSALDCPDLVGFAVYGFPEKAARVLEALG